MLFIPKALAQVNIEQEFSPANSFPTFGELLNVLVKNSLVVAGVIFFVLLALGGFGFIINSGSGDTKKMETGKQAVMSAIIGLIIVVSAIWIIQIIETLTGLNILKPSFN